MTTFCFGTQQEGGGGGGGSAAGLIKTGQSSSYVTGDDGNLQKGASRSGRFTDNSDGTISDSIYSLQWIKAPWNIIPGTTVTPAASKGQYYFGTSYSVGDVVMANSEDWYSEMIPSYNESSTYAKGAIVSYYDGSNTHYWHAMWNISAYQSPSTWGSPWQQLPDGYGGVFICIAAHTSPTLNYWMWDTSGTVWSTGDKCTDGMYDYQCVLGYTQATSDPYPSEDSTHWEVLNAYDATILHADTTHWALAPFLLTANDYTQRLQFQFSTWCAFANALTFAGHSDWRVPNALELCSMFNFGSGQFDGVTNGYYTILTATPIGEPSFSQSTPVFSSNAFSNYGEGAMLDYTPGMTYLVRSTV